MSTLIKIFLMLIPVSIAFALLGFSIYGIVLAFSASVALGIITLFLEPLPLIFGLVKYFAHVNLAAAIMDWFHKL